MFEDIKKFFEKKEIVYCQTCERDITQEGGFVTNDGNIYCAHGTRECFLSASMKGDFYMDYRTYKEVQEDIKEKKLTHFGKLEHVLKG
jgi:hypothetical protein